MPHQARVLIVAKDDRLAGPLCEGLDRLGWRTVTARGPRGALIALEDLGIEAVAIDLTSLESEDAAHALARQIRQWLDEATPLASTERPLCAGDILILVRSRTAAASRPASSAQTTRS